MPISEGQTVTDVLITGGLNINVCSIMSGFNAITSMMIQGNNICMRYEEYHNISLTEMHRSLCYVMYSMIVGCAL